MTRRTWDWRSAGPDYELTGSVNYRRNAEDKARSVHKKGAVTTISRYPHTYYLVPKDRTSGMKWEKR